MTRDAVAAAAIRRPLAVLILAVVLVGVAWVAPARAQVSLPAGFVDEPIASVSFPTALAFTSDGRLLVTTQAGELRVVVGGTLVTTPALTLGSRVCTQSERGLLGVAVDPAFAQAGENWIYLYYTHNDGVSCRNRIARFRLSPANVIDPSSEQVLVDGIPSPGANHNGGDLHFGRDGLLYASVGDGGTDLDGTGCCAANDNARHPHLLLGKILRIEKDGGIPAANPFQGAGTGRCNVTGGASAGTTCREIYATGLRNPFRIAFDGDAPGTRFFINDVGQNRAEEVSLGQAGADYGWNVCEAIWNPHSPSTNALCTPPGSAVAPLHHYRHDEQNCRTITGGAFVPIGVWPAEYDRDYLYGDYICGKIFRLENDGSNRRELASGLGGGSIVAMTFRPSEQALYYATYAPPSNPQVRRIRYTGAANRSPVATIAATPASGPAPLAVSFDGRGSTDPDGDPLAYTWDLDGDGIFGDSTSPTPSRTYGAGTHTVRLRVTDGRGGESTTSTTVRADEPPSPPSSGRAPVLVGRALTGELLHADPGLWHGVQPVAFEYRWERCGSAGRTCRPVAGAGGRSYRLRAADLGRRLRVVVTARNVAGSGRAASSLAPVVRSAVVLHRIQPRARTLNGEWVELRNRARVPVSLRGWTLGNGAGAGYRFGPRRVPPGATVRVHTGRGANTARHRYWQRARSVWRNTRGHATLVAPGPRLADACRYAGPFRTHLCRRGSTTRTIRVG